MTDHIGARLARAREESGFSLRQIADNTKLPVRFLESLEKNRISQLPGGIYRRSIVRLYAREIGLDPETMVRAFLAEHPDDLPPPPSRTQDADEVLVAQSGADRRETQTNRRHSLMQLVGAVGPVLAGIFYFSWRAR